MPWAKFCISTSARSTAARPEHVEPLGCVQVQQQRLFAAVEVFVLLVARVGGPTGQRDGRRSSDSGWGSLILMTSAPYSTRMRPVHGPATTWVRSRTRMPVQRRRGAIASAAAAAGTCRARRGASRAARIGGAVGVGQVARPDVARSCPTGAPARPASTSDQAPGRPVATTVRRARRARSRATPTAVRTIAVGAPAALMAVSHSCAGASKTAPA